MVFQLQTADRGRAVYREQVKVVHTILHCGGALGTGPAGIGKPVFLLTCPVGCPVQHREFVNVCTHSHAVARLVSMK